MDTPELSPKLKAKLKDSGLDLIANILASYEANRISLDRIDELPESERIVDWVCPEGYTSPVGEDEVANYFLVHSAAKLKDEHLYFVATSDWSRLAVPISLLPPTVFADPILKRWAWMYENLAGERECKRLANAIVRRRDGIALEDPTQITFKVATPKGEHVFITTGQWRGLKAPAYMVPPEQQPARRISHVRVMDEEEAVGEKQVKKAAKEWARNFDKVKIQEPNPMERMSKSKRRQYWIDEPQNEKIKHTMRYLQTLDFGAVISQSGALRFLIDAGFESVPPESEWPKRKPFPWQNVGDQQA